MNRPDAARLRAAALALPETVEEFPWGHTAVKVRGKAFVFLSGEGEALSVSCKLPASHGAALLLPFAAPTGYGLGKSGWVTATFPKGQLAPVELLVEWIGESYQAIAPKKLGALVGSAAGAKDMAARTGAATKVAAARATAAKKAASAKVAAPEAASAKVAAPKATAAKAAAARVAAAKATGAKKVAAPAKKAAAKKAAGRRVSASRAG